MNSLDKIFNAGEIKYYYVIHKERGFYRGSHKWSDDKPKLYLRLNDAKTAIRNWLGHKDYTIEMRQNFVDKLSKIEIRCVTIDTSIISRSTVTLDIENFIKTGKL